MKFFSYFFDLGVYEGDIIAAGGSVDYTGEVIYQGYSYSIEGACLSLNGYSLHGYMKRFKRGNAVLCSYGNNEDDVSSHKKIARCDILLALNDMDRRSANFFEFRLFRDFLLWLIAIGEIILLISAIICFCKFIIGFRMAYLFLMAISGMGLSLMFYLRMACKAKTPLSYKAKLWTDEQLQRYEMPSDEDLLNDKK